MKRYYAKTSFQTIPDNGPWVVHAYYNRVCFVLEQ